MNLQYTSNKSYVIIFSSIALILIFAPPLIAYISTGNPFLIIIASAVIYIFYSPLIAVLIYLAIKNARVKIEIGGSGISSYVSGKTVTIQWDDVQYFIYDFIGISGGAFRYTRYYALFEVSGLNERIRFNRILTIAEKSEISDITPISAFQKKAFSFESYGLYLSEDKCRSLNNMIRDYTGKEPERKAGFF